MNDQQFKVDGREKKESKWFLNTGGDIQLHSERNTNSNHIMITLSSCQISRNTNI